MVVQKSRPPRSHQQQPAPQRVPSEFDAHSQNYFARSHSNRRLPDAVELASRLEEARTSATLLHQVVSSTPPSEVLQNDLTHFARMVDEAPAGALDPNSSNYLFHADSAAAKGTTTSRQNQTMYDDPNVAQSQTTQETNQPIYDKDITGTTNQQLYTENPGNPSIGGQPAPAPFDPPISNRELPGY